MTRSSLASRAAGSTAVRAVRAAPRAASGGMTLIELMVVVAIVALLGAVTSAGRLYETDMRLRPDGGKSLLVSTLSSYEDYQRQRAWTWEHQALVRARPVAGDASLREAFERVRAQTLGQGDRQTTRQRLLETRDTDTRHGRFTDQEQTKRLT